MSDKRVLFHKLSSPKEKLQWLYESVYSASQRGERVYIYVESLKVAQFVDNFLWEYPKESFLPHSIEDSVCQVMVAIGWESKNLNGASTLVNLSKKPFLDGGFLHVNEFFELGMEASIQDKKNMYKESAYAVN